MSTRTPEPAPPEKTRLPETDVCTVKEGKTVDDQIRAAVAQQVTQSAATIAGLRQQLVNRQMEIEDLEIEIANLRAQKNRCVA